MMVSFTACCQGLQDKTLRLDYIFNGTDTTCDISLHGMTSWDGWSGRTVNLKDVPVAGNGEINAGMKTCFFDPQGKGVPDGMKLDHVVRSLSEVETYVLSRY